MKDILVLSPTEFSELLRSVIREELTIYFDAKQATELLSPAQAAELFSPKISIQTLTNFVRRGVLTKHRIGRRTFFKRADILGAIQTSKSSSNG
jgi:hypothetical protein